MLSRLARQSADRYRSQFEGARPFKHVCMDGFFDPAVAERLVRAFPSFETADALNEFGAAGKKAVVEKISDIGPAYRDLAAFLGSGDLSAFLTRVTGIDGLMWPGESVYGGGTHENLDGNHLDAHVDFNYHDQAGLHRRLNLIIFLTEEWSDGWGGQLQFHSDPRTPERDEVRSFAPTFNRCVLFETNERSWHGFPRIALPLDKKHVSRKSLAVYFYTRERPREEVVGAHTTFYVLPSLPDTVRPGAMLSAEDYDAVRSMLEQRDAFIKLYQDMEVRWGAERAELIAERESLLRAPAAVPVVAPGPWPRTRRLVLRVFPQARSIKRWLVARRRPAR